MTIDHKIKDGKIQYDINREAAIISTLLSDRFDKYEYLTGEEILSSDQSRIIEQTKITYYPLGKAFGKQIKTIEDQGTIQVEALKALKQKENKEDIKSVERSFAKQMRTNENKNEKDEIKKWEETLKEKI